MAEADGGPWALHSLEMHLRPILVHPHLQLADKEPPPLYHLRWVSFFSNISYLALLMYVDGYFFTKKV